MHEIKERSDGEEWAAARALGDVQLYNVQYILMLSHVQLCDPRDCSPPGFSVHGMSQERILGWVVISFFRGSSRPRMEPTSLKSPALAGEFLCH